MTRNFGGTVEAVIGGAASIKEVVNWALELSTWFQVRPLPLDNYRIEMRDEFYDALAKYERRYPANPEPEVQP